MVSDHFRPQHYRRRAQLIPYYAFGTQIASPLYELKLEGPMGRV